MDSIIYILVSIVLFVLFLFDLLLVEIMMSKREGRQLVYQKKNAGKKVDDSRSKKRTPKIRPSRRKTADSQTIQKKNSQSRRSEQQIHANPKMKKKNAVAVSSSVKKQSQRKAGARKADTVRRRPKKVKGSYKIISFIGNLFFYTMTIGIIAMAVMFSFSSKSTASIFGYRFYTVLTNSMVPQKNGPTGGFFAGDIVIVQMMDGSKVKEKDIVTFSVGDGTRYLTHRVVEKREELNGEQGQFLVTKGDANKSNDPPIEASRVVGKVVTVLPKVGSVLDFVRAEFWACLISVISLYGFFLVIKAYLFTPEVVQPRKRKKRPMYQ